MKLNVKHFLFFVGFIVTLFLFFLFRYPIHLQSSLNDLLPPKINGQMLPKEVTEKYANLLNIVVESDSFDIAKEKSDMLANELNISGIKSVIYNIPKNIPEKSLDYFKTYQNSFLSSETRLLLLNADTEKVRENAIQQIQTSWMPRVTSLHDDPFLLLSEYIQNISQTDLSWSEREGVLWQEKDGKNYILILVQLDQGDVYSLSKKIHLIQKISTLQNSNYKIHLSGAPIHTVQMFEKTKNDIFLISLLAIFMLLTLTYSLFHCTQSIVMVAFNLVVAFVSGLLSVFLFSPHVHFLTLSFGTSLVGICIDYSFHRFYCQDKKLPSKLFKNILYSYLTSISCFIPLLFTDLSLLRQISIFTIGGLSGTFLWILITPIPSCPKLTNSTFNLFRLPFKKTFFCCMIILCMIGLTQVRIDHSSENLYKPSEELRQAELFFHNVNGELFNQLILIHGNDIQSILEKEEKIKETEYFFSLSTLLPSVKRQNENFELIKNFYDKEAKNMILELGGEKVPIMKKTPVIDENDFQEQFDFLFQRFIVDTSNGKWSVIPLKNSVNIKEEDVIIFNPSKYLSNVLDEYASKSYRILFLSFCCLFLILCFMYRRRAFQYLFPSLLGGIGAISLISLYSHGITFFHLLSLFMVIGLSMDYTIFLLSSQQTNKPVLFSFLSSFIGFGLLSFIHFQMIAMMGQTIALGLFLSFITTLMIKKIS